ncbi:MAG: glycosyl transferase [Lachnospiraceae bacterium]|nr:glycosyl transferase [Lachnospiraceae bacterium]
MDFAHFMRTAGRFLTDPAKRFNYLAKLGIYDRMPDEEYLTRIFYNELGYPLDLQDPKTFNEKQQWLKINGFYPIYTDYADKVKVKKLVAGILGEEYIIPTYAVWERAEDIDFDSLPDRFVMKCNHTSSVGICICKDKNTLDREAVRRMMRKALKTDYFSYRREKVYRDIERRILAEEMLFGEDGAEPADYKVYVFNGKSGLIEMDIDRFTNHRRNFYDREWNYVPFAQSSCFATDPGYRVPDKVKEQGTKLFELAEKVTAGIGTNPPYLRVDFYIAQDKILFGEVTFYDAAGLERFQPEEYDRKLGDMIDLTNARAPEADA